MGYAMKYKTDKNGKGFPFKEIEEKQFSTIEDDPNRVNVSDEYEVGDLISEDDLESSFSQTGDDPKNYPQLSVQDYSRVRKGDKGKYVTKISEEEAIGAIED